MTANADAYYLQNPQLIQQRIHDIFSHQNAVLPSEADLNNLAFQIQQGAATFDNVRALAQAQTKVGANPLPPNSQDGSGPAAGGNSQQAPNSDLPVLQNLLNQYGLGALLPQVQAWIVEGYNEGAIEALIQQTPQWQQRFSGNQQRIAQGLAPLSPSEYLSTEAAYKQALAAAGLPAGFYDSRDDFAKWIGENKSPSEIASRALGAVQAVNDSDPYFKQALAQYHGLSSGDIAAYFLDDKRALPLLEQQVQQSKIGAAALRQGLNLPGDRAMQYASQGVTQAQAENAFSQIGAVLPQEQLLGQISGTPYTQLDAENEFVNGLASAARKRRLLNQQEQARFAGSGGADSRALMSNQPGSY